MRDELQTLHDAIEQNQLPIQFEEIFEPMWNPELDRFHVQETYILDYKENLPEKFTDDYGSGLIRLAIAFHNTFGGIIVFGVKDRVLSITGIDKSFEIEGFNRVLSDFSGIKAECKAKSYVVKTKNGPKTIAALLIPRRDHSQPVRLLKPLKSYPEGLLWVRDRHEAVQANVKHLPTLFSDRKSPPSGVGPESSFPVHRSLPPSPATVRDFVNRGTLLFSLWEWFVFGDQPRLYLHGPGGSGKSTLAFEFARQLSEHGNGVTSSRGDRLDYVVYLTGKETEFNPATGRQQKFVLRQFSDANEQFIQILYHAGIQNTQLIAPKTQQELNHLLRELFTDYSGLIVIDDIDALSRRGVDTGEESLFMKIVLAQKRTRILYTLRFPPPHALNSSLKVPGLEETTEFFKFLEACCKQFSVTQPPADQIPHIQEATSRLPLLIETVIGLRRNCSSYVEALRLFRDRGGEAARRLGAIFISVNMIAWKALVIHGKSWQDYCLLENLLVFQLSRPCFNSQKNVFAML
jgi:hypothetical protein